MKYDISLTEWPPHRRLDEAGAGAGGEKKGARGHLRVRQARSLAKAAGPAPHAELGLRHQRP
jgi:hypothetical protein